MFSFANMLAGAYRRHPLLCLLLTAGTARLAAAILAQGYMANDDYFVYLHVPWLWTHGIPRWFDMDHPSGFSLVYPGMNYLFFKTCGLVSITDPGVIMLINRLIHGIWSLGAVAAAYLLAREATDDCDTAIHAGLLVALLSFLPYGSVRNLPEVVSVPLVMTSLYFGERATRTSDNRDALIAGVVAGAAFVLRYQTFLFFAGPLLLFPLRRQWRIAMLYTAGLAAPLFAQGMIDLIAYGKFFGAPIQYFDLSSFLQNSSSYPTGPWYRYLLLLFGIFIPPFSLFLLAGTWRGARRLPVTAIGTALFVVFHSVIAPKQERFIIPAIAPLLVLGAIGIGEWTRSGLRPWLATIQRWSWRWFWSLNAILLLLFLSHYGKRGQIEALLFLRAQGDMHRVLVDRTENDCWLPLFYGDLQEDAIDWITERNEYARLQTRLDSGKRFPTYALVLDPTNIQAHVDSLAAQQLRLLPLKYFGPGVLEWLLWRLNPRYNKPNAVWVCKLNREK
jgi:hypothetical protein